MTYCLSTWTLGANHVGNLPNTPETLNVDDRLVRGVVGTCAAVLDLARV